MHKSLWLYYLFFQLIAKFPMAAILDLQLKKVTHISNVHPGRGGATEPYQTPSWVTVFVADDQPPPHLPSSVVSVFYRNEVRPPQLPSSVVSVFYRNEVRPPQLPSSVVSVFYPMMLTPPHLASMWTIVF